MENLKSKYFMQLALMQASKVLGQTKKNPAVGCVIVKDGYLVSAGHTGINGVPHAEFNAIRSGKSNVKNSDLYVTLEPCSNYGKTPPCTKLIIKKKIKKVFFSIKDPDLRSFDKSSKNFKKNNIFVNNNINKIKIDHFYRSYKKYKNENLPFVTCKLAVSKDFYTINNKKKWITNKFSRGRVHLIRGQHDCLITGVKTVIKDNPTLNCRIKGLENRSPTRIILDSKLNIPMSSNILKTSKTYKTIIFYNKNNKKKIKLLKKYNIKFIKGSILPNGHFDLKKILIKIKYLGYSRILLESGLDLVYSFLQNKLISDFYLFISSKKLKKYGERKIKQQYKFFFNKSKNITVEKINLFGDKLITYKLK